MTTTTVKVQGMTCDHCVRAVAGELAELPGVSGVDVVLTTGLTTISSDGPLDDGAVRAAVEEAGYRVDD